MDLFDFLSTKKFSFIGDVNTKYFQQNSDGTYNATPLFIYSIAKDLSNNIKSIIISRDDPKYVKHQKIGTNGYDIKDTKALHEHNAIWYIKYKDKIETVNNLYKEYREKHIDEYYQSAPTIDVDNNFTSKFFLSYSQNFEKMTNEELIKLYKAAKELYKRYEDDLKNMLPMKPGKYMSKLKFKADHLAIKELFEEEVGLPKDNFSIPVIHKTERIMIISSASKEYKSINAADGSSFNDYAECLADYVNNNIINEQSSNEIVDIYIDEYDDYSEVKLVYSDGTIVFLDKSDYFKHKSLIKAYPMSYIIKQFATDVINV